MVINIIFIIIISISISKYKYNMTIIDDYLGYTRKWKTEYGERTIVLIQVGSFFEVYGIKEKDGNVVGSNIVEFSQLCDMVVSCRNQKHKGKQVMMAGFGLAQIDKYVKKLQNAGYTIAIYTQDAQTKNTTRSLSEIISPGTYFSNDATVLSNNILCVWIHQTNKTKYTASSINIGIAYIDNCTGNSNISQFQREYYKDSSTYDDLERIVSITKPYECIIVSNLSQELTSNITNYAGLNNTTVHIVNKDIETDMKEHALNAEKQVYQNEIMNKFFPSISQEIIVNNFHEYEFAMQAFTMLIDFIYQHNPSLVYKISYPLFEQQSEKLLLANHSLKQLNIIDDDRHSGKLSSVLSLLNNCMTYMGKRSFMYSLTNPSTNVDIINSSYILTEYCLENKKWDFIRNEIKNIKDIDKFVRKLTFKRVSPKDIVIFYNDLVSVSNTLKYLSKDKFLSQYINENGYNCSSYVNEFIELISTEIDIKKAIKIDDISKDKLGLLTPDEACFINICINDDIGNLLKKGNICNQQLVMIQEYLSQLVQSMESRSSKTTAYIKIHETPKTDPVLMGTNRRVKLLQAKISGYKENDKKVMIGYDDEDDDDDEYKFELDLSSLSYFTIGSNKKDLCISSPQISKITSSIQKTRDILIDKLTEYFALFINSILEQSDKIHSISKFISWVDNLQNKCYIADKYNYSKPEIDNNKDKSFFDIQELRHPLIEQLQINELYVTNDLELGDKYDGLLLYGTNAVGKTSFIRAIGISIIMAQAGLYVPCKSMIYKPYTKIFTRILGNDNLFKGLSTFAVEMSELRTILNMSDMNSLIIGDELCSGTESDSARSIFTTGIEWLHNLNSTFIFATHFHEINDYSEINELSKITMKHMEVIYDHELDCLVYDRKLKDGPGTSMYGLEVCKALNLPQEFLSRAYSIRMKYDPKQTNILSQKPSKYNSKKLKGNCEICGKQGDEIHHLKHQVNADDNDFIESHHKNHPANLINICETCHDILHSNKNNNMQHKVVKTTDGYKIVELN